MHDLGEQNLKDIQPEHIFELSVDGHSSASKPLKTATPQARSDDLSARFEERIQSYVERQLERALGGDGAAAQGEPPALPAKLALGGLGIAFAGLACLALLIALVGVLVKLVSELADPFDDERNPNAMPSATVTAISGRSSNAFPPK